jgi:class 3 adenylate cyclase
MSSQHTSSLTLEEWAGSQNLNLTLVFTDIVHSTLIGKRLGDRKWIEELFIHFSQARSLTDSVDCFVVKAIGDSLMMAFRTSTDAVDFALAFLIDTGVDHIGIRVGINSGQVHLRENDIYGLNVNFTLRVQHALEGEGILVSNSVMRDYQKTFGLDSPVKFLPRQVKLKSFGEETLYFTFQPCREAIRKHAKARIQILGVVPASSPNAR